MNCYFYYITRFVDIQQKINIVSTFIILIKSFKYKKFLRLFVNENCVTNSDIPFSKKEHARKHRFVTYSADKIKLPDMVEVEVAK